MGRSGSYGYIDRLIDLIRWIRHLLLWIVISASFFKAARNTTLKTVLRLKKVRSGLCFFRVTNWNVPAKRSYYWLNFTHIRAQQKPLASSKCPKITFFRVCSWCWKKRKNKASYTIIRPLQIKFKLSKQSHLKYKYTVALLLAQSSRRTKKTRGDELFTALKLS